LLVIRGGFRCQVSGVSDEVKGQVEEKRST